MIGNIVSIAYIDPKDPFEEPLEDLLELLDFLRRFEAVVELVFAVFFETLLETLLDPLDFAICYRFSGKRKKKRFLEKTKKNLQ